MERIRIAAGWLIAVAIVGAFGVATPALTGAASKVKKPEEEAPAEPNDDGTRRTSRVVKLRQGSLLRRDKPFDEAPDLRGELERRRDTEVVRHYTRAAQLDVIEEVARDQNDLRLLERVESVRRKETRRFWDAMQRLSEEARRKTASGTP
jgi:hypothetical protein